MAFLKLDCLDAFYGGAAGGGKSDALLMAGLQYVDCENYNAILVRDTFKNLSMSGALIDRAHEWLQGTEAHWDGENRRWKFPSKATLGFGYLDGPRDHFNYQSSEFQFVGIDEVVNIRENQARYLFSRLRRLEGSNIPIRFRCASNPPTREQASIGSWVKDRYVDTRTRKENVIFVSAKLQDNPYLDKGEYIKSLNELDPVTREQLLKGDWNVRAKGAMFDRSWFDMIDESPTDISYVRFWDRAATEPAKEGHEPKYTCGEKWGKKNGVYYITSVVRFRKSSRMNETIIRQTADMDGKNVSIGMEQEPGSSGKDTIDHYRRNILPEFVFKGYPATGSKIERASPWASQAEAGNIKLVKAEWNEAFLNEIELFPDGTFSDQVDAGSGAFSMLAKPKIARIRGI